MTDAEREELAIAKEYEERAFTRAMENALHPEMKHFIRAVTQIDLSNPQNVVVVQATARGMVRAMMKQGFEPDDYVVFPALG